MKRIISIIVSILLICLTIVPIAFSANAVTTTTLTDMYKEENYTTVSANPITFEADAIKTQTGQSKAMYNYAKNMQGFTSSVKITTATNGALQAGVTFHAQADKFSANEGFSTPGYFVMLRRSSTTSKLNKLELVIRYYDENNTAQTTAISKSATIETTKQQTFRLDIRVDDTQFIVNVFDNDGTNLIENATYALNKEGNSRYWANGAFAIMSNGTATFKELSVVADGTFPLPTDPPADPLDSKYIVYGEADTVDNYTSLKSGEVVRGIIKGSESKTDFSADLIVKADAAAKLQSGIVFRVQNIEDSKYGMDGYAVVAQKRSNGKLGLFLYKYGAPNGNYAFLGTLDSITTDFIVAAEEQYNIHINVVGENLEAYCYNISDSNVKSDILKVSLKTVGNSSDNPSKYYDAGGIGFYMASGSIKALDLAVNNAEALTPEEPEVTPPQEPDVTPPEQPVGTPAEENYIGSASKGEFDNVLNITTDNLPEVTVNSLDKYTSDFYNYTYYSSSASNKFLITDNGIVSDTTGTKRAILDGVTVKGFHSTATMKIGAEGTLRSGIIFRLNDVEKGLQGDGTLGASDVEGYTAILYKTPGSNGTFARVVLLIYKYGVKNGEYKYLGTIASKASEVPLSGCENNIADAAGKQLTLDVNVIDDQITAYFYNAENPALKSETLVADLNDETDAEASTPSLKGVKYSSGAIGLTATDYVTFTKFTVGEPIYPSNDVGSLSQLESFTVYGSGVEEKDGYFTANSSGTKKMIVNNLTVDDFTASVDMTIDENGNLKSGFFFRVNDVGNGGDAQTGYAIIVSRNFNNNGETNPNRIDIVIFKWGYVDGKLTYLGEVAREAYKSDKTFMDGKMAGEELTFVIRVKGAVLDATLYQKKDLKNKPATFSTNLKFAASKEKDSVAYYESGSIGLYLGNSSSEPYNINKLRNFHVNDGSSVKVKTTFKSVVNSLLSNAPATGEGIFMTLVTLAFVISLSALVGLFVYNKQGKKETGDNTL